MVARRKYQQYARIIKEVLRVYQSEATNLRVADPTFFELHQGLYPVGCRRYASELELECLVLEQTRPEPTARMRCCKT